MAARASPAADRAPSPASAAQIRGCRRKGHLALVAGAGSHSALPTDLMLYAHLVAAALVAGWLWVGERRAWAAVRRVARVVLTRPAIGPIPPPARPMPPEPERSPAARFLRHAMARRGLPGPA